MYRSRRRRLRLGRSYEMLAQPSEAERALQQALRLAPVSDRSAIRVRLAWIAFRQDQVTLAKRRLTIAFQGLDGRPTDRQALAKRIELVLLRAAIRDLQGDRAGSDEDARWAQAEAEKLRRTDLPGEAVMQLALNADAADDPAADVEQLAASARSLLGDARKHYEMGVLDLNLGISLMVRSRWSQALALFEAAAASYTRCGAVLGALMTDANRGGILVEQGRLDEALDLFDSVVRRARAAEHIRIEQFATGSAERARAWLGEADEAVVSLTPLIEALDEAGRVDEAFYLRWYRAESLVLAGRFPEAVDETSELLAAVADRPGDAAVGAALTRLAAIAACFLGKPGAQDELRASLELARELDATYEVVRALHALEGLVPEPDPAWREEREQLCALLGVVRLPPITAGSPVPDEASDSTT